MNRICPFVIKSLIFWFYHITRNTKHTHHHPYEKAKGQIAKHQISAFRWHKCWYNPYPDKGNKLAKSNSKRKPLERQLSWNWVWPIVKYACIYILTEPQTNVPSSGLLAFAIIWKLGWKLRMICCVIQTFPRAFQIEWPSSSKRYYML